LLILCVNLEYLSTNKPLFVISIPWFTNLPRHRLFAATIDVQYVY